MREILDNYFSKKKKNSWTRVLDWTYCLIKWTFYKRKILRYVKITKKKCNIIGKYFKQSEFIIPAITIIVVA